MPRYFSFVIRIHARQADDDTYAVDAHLGDGRVFQGARLALDWNELYLSALQQDATEHGRTLHRALFSPPIRRAYDEAVGTVHGNPRQWSGLRVRLWIDEHAPELHALAWERLYHQHAAAWGPLACSAWTPFSRYVALPTPDPAPALARPLRMLVVIANPGGLPATLPAIDVDAEVESLCRALGGLPRPGHLEAAFMPGHTGVSAPLRAALETAGHTVIRGPSSVGHVMAELQQRYQIVHFLGHGHFDPCTRVATIHCEADDGAWVRVVDTEITTQLQGLIERPRLVFLAACQSATRSEQDAFLGLAPRLVCAEIPAVIAMQERVSVEHARTFTAHFYRNLLAHGIVDLAANQARNQLLSPAHLDWAIPVLFTRLTDGALFSPPPERLDGNHERTLSDGDHEQRFHPISERGGRRSDRSPSAVWNRLALVPPIILLLAPTLGLLAHRSREVLLGISEPQALEYPASEYVIAGLAAVVRLLQYMVIGLFTGLHIERWAVLLLVAALGVGAWFHRRGRARSVVVWLAALVPVLAFALLFYAQAVGVHHVAMPSGAGDWTCEPGPSVPQQIRFEVCSWLFNVSEQNHGRRVALAGLAVWLAAALAAAAWLAMRTAWRPILGQTWRKVAAVTAVAHGVLLLFMLLQIPRGYAVAHWGLAYPRITEIDARCDPPGLAAAVAAGTCYAVNVSAGAVSEAVIIWSDEAVDDETAAPRCPLPPNAAASEARLVRLGPPAGMAPGQRCIRDSQELRTILGGGR
jgi:hypothetical protein